MVTTLFTKTPLEILGECSGARILLENMSMGMLFERKERRFRDALNMLLGTDRNIEQIRSMTVQQFLAYRAQEQRLDANDLP